MLIPDKTNLCFESSVHGTRRNQVLWLCLVMKTAKAFCAQKWLWFARIAICVRQPNLLLHVDANNSLK